jgi:hypothetical protein
MNAEYVVQALNARWITKDRFSAACPVHGGRSKTALKGRVLPDRIVLNDFGGCDTAEILKAAGLTWSDLFDGPTRQDSAADRKRRAVEGLRRWRADEMLRCGQELRRRDMRRLTIGAAVRAGTMTEVDAWNSLELIYCGYSELEYRFEVLRTETDRDALEMYRNG